MNDFEKFEKYLLDNYKSGNIVDLDKLTQEFEKFLGVKSKRLAIKSLKKLFCLDIALFAVDENGNERRLNIEEHQDYETDFIILANKLRLNEILGNTEENNWNVLYETVNGNNRFGRKFKIIEKPYIVYPYKKH